MAERNYLVDLNLNGAQLKNARMDNREGTTSLNAADLTGAIIFDTTSNATALKYSDGKTFLTVASKEWAEYELGLRIHTDKRGTENGVASLDEHALIPVGELNTANVANGVVVRGQEIGTNQLLQWDGSKFVGYSPTTAITPKGSLATFDLLPEVTTADVGDMYSIESEFTYETKKYPAGTNVVCVLSSPGNIKKWDPLGGTVDLTPFQLKENLKNTLDSANATTYPTTAVVKTELDKKLDKLASKPTQGTYTKVTIDGEGRVTAGAALALADIPDLGTKYIAVTQKGAASGVAPLGADTKVPIANIPTGNGTNLIPVPSAAGTAGQVLTVNAQANGFEFKTPAVNPINLDYFSLEGNGTATTWTWVHGRSQKPASLQVFDSTGNEVFVAHTQTDSSITFEVNKAPSAGTSYIAHAIWASS